MLMYNKEHDISFKTKHRAKVIIAYLSYTLFNKATLYLTLRNEIVRKLYRNSLYTSNNIK